MSKNRSAKYLENLINQFSIKAPNPKAEISTLSGGNMQKLLMGRELISNPEVIIASQPTRGLDVNAVEAIHNLLVEQRDKGSAILMISEDLDELLLSHSLSCSVSQRLLPHITTFANNSQNLVGYAEVDAAVILPGKSHTPVCTS